MFSLTFGFSTELNNDIIVERITNTLDKYDFEYDLKWTFNGDPFLTDAGSLLDAIVDAVGHVNDVKPALRLQVVHQTDALLRAWKGK